MEKPRNVQIALAHSRAKTIIIQHHRDEFNEILAEVYAERGLVVRQRRTKEQKHLADVEKAMNALKETKEDTNEG